MDKEKLLKPFKSKKAKDYTYLIGFFLTFSFFLFVVIRPNILSVIQKQAKIDELKRVNDFYEKQINKVIELQTVFETSRNDIGLLKEAVSVGAQVNKILSDTNTVAQENDLVIGSINIADLNLKDTGDGKKVKSIELTMQLTGDFPSMRKFIQTVYNQRRLKMIKSLTISRGEKTASDSGLLNMDLELEGFYL